MICVLVEGGKSVPVTGQEVKEVVDSFVFNDWLRRFDHKKLELRGIQIQSADVFGERVVFVKMKCEVIDRETGKPVPGIVFLRGDSVTVLLFVVCKETGAIYVVTTQQTRVPLGSAVFEEIPAGMLDGDEIVSRALSEIREETGLVVSKKQLKPVGSFHPSAGGCDEQIGCFAATVYVSKKRIAKLESWFHGLEKEGERIRIIFRPLREFIIALRDGKVTDGKAYVALFQYLLQIEGMVDRIYGTILDDLTRK